MQFALTSLLTLVATTIALPAPATNDPSINTPVSVVQCQPVQLTWTATHSPVYISLIPAGEPGGTPLKDFGEQSGSSYTWTADLPAGQSCTVQIRDAVGSIAYSAPVDIQSSSDSSCLNQSS